jgi:hypothetical protein
MEKHIHTLNNNNLSLKEILLIHYKQLLLDYIKFAKESSEKQIGLLNTVINDLESATKNPKKVQACHTNTSRKYGFCLTQRQKQKLDYSPLFVELENFHHDIKWQDQQQKCKSIYFQNNYAEAILASPTNDGIVKTSKVQIGLSILAPYTDYPMHSHPSTAIHIVLSGKALWYEEGLSSTATTRKTIKKNSPLKTNPTNSIIFHPSSKVNAIRTKGETLLVLTCRAGDIASSIKWATASTNTSCLCHNEVANTASPLIVNWNHHLTCNDCTYMFRACWKKINKRTIASPTPLSSATINFFNDGYTINEFHDDNPQTSERKGDEQKKKQKRVRSETSPSSSPSSSGTKRKKTKTYYRGAVEARIHQSNSEWQFFSSIVEASKILGVNRGSISSVCKARALNKDGFGQKRAGEYEFRYADSSSSQHMAEN